jgi:hypothetical protein
MFIDRDTQEGWVGCPAIDMSPLRGEDSGNKLMASNEFHTVSEAVVVIVIGPGTSDLNVAIVNAIEQPFLNQADQSSPPE